MNGRIPPSSSPPDASGGYRSVTDGDLRQPIELNEFLFGLGIVLRLPPKRGTTAAEVLEEPQRSQIRHRSRIVQAAVALSCAVALAIVVPAFVPDSSDPLPPTLIGSWHTQSPKYANRGFAIRNEVLQMQRGALATDMAVLPIRRVRVSTRGRDTAVEIRYEENGVLQSLDLTMHDYRGATVLELRNQPDVIWRRRGSASAPELGRALSLPPGVEAKR